jgi:hypothetical protein
MELKIILNNPFHNHSTLKKLLKRAFTILIHPVGLNQTDFLLVLNHSGYMNNLPGDNFLYKLPGFYIFQKKQTINNI